MSDSINSFEKGLKLVRRAYDGGDSEVAHIEEDGLLWDFVRFVAENPKDERIPVIAATLLEHDARVAAEPNWFWGYL